MSCNGSVTAGPWNFLGCGVGYVFCFHSKRQTDVNSNMCYEKMQQEWHLACLDVTLVACLGARAIGNPAEAEF